MMGYNQVYDAKTIMGAQPLVAPNAAKKFINRAFRTNAPDNFSIDDLVNHYMNSEIDGRVQSSSNNMIQTAIQEQQFVSQIFSGESNASNIRIHDARVNDYGEFFQNQLNQVIPYLLFDPIRGISFMTMPIVSFNNAGQKVTYQAYDWNMQFKRVIDTETSNTPQVQVAPRSLSNPIFDYDGAVGITWNEARAVQAARGQQMGPFVFDPYVGSINPIAMKFIGLRLEYMLELDNIAYGGTPNLNNIANAEFSSLIGNNGSVSTNGVPFITVNNILGVGTFSSFAALTPDQMVSVLTGVINNVSKVSSTTSSGNFAANVLRIDLNSYLVAASKTNPYKDTTPLGWLIANKSVDAIIPVAAWNQIYPSMTTMVAEFNDPQVYFYNIAQPLIQTGVELQKTATEFGYRYRTSGISLVNALGLTQFQMGA